MELHYGILKLGESIESRSQWPLPGSSMGHLLFIAATFALTHVHRLTCHHHCSRAGDLSLLPPWWSSHLSSCPLIIPKSFLSSHQKIYLKCMSILPSAPNPSMTHMALQKINLELPKVNYKCFLIWFLPTLSAPSSISPCLKFFVSMTLNLLQSPCVCHAILHFSAFAYECAVPRMAFPTLLPLRSQAYLVTFYLLLKSASR